jgi:hypothetical protein
MAPKPERVGVGRTVGGCLLLAVCLQLMVAFSPAGADDGDAPAAPVNCSADRLPFAPTATVTWSHDGVNVDKYVVEKSRNGDEFFWDGAPLAPTNEHLATELGELDTYVFRVRAKAADGTLSTDAVCADVEHAAEAIDVAIDPTQFMDRPDEVVGVGVGLNWLLDSDLHRPRTQTNVEAINELGAGILRFPFGHLSDNYLWNTPPWDADLQPRIASQHETPGLLTPGNRDWSWAVADDGSFIDAMDFDEFADVTAQTGTQSVVVINAAAHRYEDGPTYEELRDTAVEWVRYAVDNALQVDFWQIGNEADHPSDSVLTSSEYSALYLDFVAAMRAIDPSISVGPGLIGLSPYSDEVMTAIDGQFDFAGVHQYVQYEDHDDWRRFTGDPVPNVTNMQRLVELSAFPDVPILVTETNSHGSGWTDGDTITTTKALALFELLARQHEAANVTASLIWTTHTPWSGEDFVGDDANVFFNDDLNERTPNGMATRLFAETMHTSRLLTAPEAQGNMRIWASIDPTTGVLSVHLLNKGTAEQDVNVTLVDAAITSVAERTVFSGQSPNDPNPTRAVDELVTLENGAVSTTVPGTGIVVLHAAFVVPPDVVVNEIHYNPLDGGAEFIELLNNGSETVDLSGFELVGFQILASGTIIEPGGFLVLTSDLQALQEDHPGVPAIEWEPGVALDDDGHRVELRTPEGVLVDLVDYR